MLIAGLLQVGAELTQQPRVIQEDGALLFPFADYREAFVVSAQIEVLDVNRECLSDA